ncbi:transketolase-like TK C-terminal-containing protein [Nocardioides ochotonae]|uniref:transketolase-like TK C-terminal-containing protein n=1 Tax=Nocardioides ochotonae TaxID=2685869 RepID=UPI001408AD21|nr:pyruvate dehydrogenase [Nocardioides ochotonae]
MTQLDAPGAAPTQGTLATLREISQRVLWLSTAIVDAANRQRPNSSGVKVGGHQASSASMVDIMVALWFHELTAEDRVSVKPHASPVLHAVNYLLGDLDPAYLPTLRSLGGLQSYPSRLKDPDTVDFSTGSVGIGATASLWAAMAHRYTSSHFSDTPRAGRFISLLGDAELDEGAIWEAVADPAVARMGELLWVVDLNRQSLDRVVPDIQIERLQGMFAAAGWQVVTLKWGRLISELFERPGGAELRVRLERMPNEEFQRMLRVGADEVADRLLAEGGSPELRALVTGLEPEVLAAAIRDLGGHDLGLLVETFAGVDEDRPTVVFAYTVKGRGLPTEGHPNNHSALLTEPQMQQLADASGTTLDDPWRGFDEGTAAARLCARRADQLRRVAVSPPPPLKVPVTLGRPHRKPISTQAALGRLLADVARDVPAMAEHVVTCSPDVASSTNLGGWINKTGVWSVTDRTDWFADDRERLLRWSETSSGRHIELGIAEVNLVGLLGELGATWSRWGQRLIPIATLYDPFVSRALEPWSYGLYAGGQSILVGTPSGVTLAPEGGAHQSITTPSIGLEQPGCVAWEPAFAQDLEWTFLRAMSQVGVAGGTSAYFRLSTRPIDPALAQLPEDPTLLERRRRHAVAGGYRITQHEPGAEQVTLVGMGAIMPEVLAAAALLEGLGVVTGVVCLTSADLVFRSFQQRGRRRPAGGGILDTLLPPEHPAPLVTVLDGHPHTLAFLAAARGDRIQCLGVTDFGQSSALEDAYALHGIDTTSIVDAALGLIGR